MLIIYPHVDTDVDVDIVDTDLLEMSRMDLSNLVYLALHALCALYIPVR